MNKLASILGSLGIGAGMMYFFDPEEGSRRRALVRDQITGALNSSDQLIDKAGRDLRNRTQGVLYEAIGVLNEDGVSEHVLEERMRAKLGHVVRNPGVIEVNSDQGEVTVKGLILADEYPRAVSYLSGVRGVKGFNDRLEVIEDLEDAQGLETGGPPPQPKFELMQEHWSPTARLFTTVGGGALALYGMTRRGLAGMMAAVTGIALAARGLTDENLKDLAGLD